MLPKTLRVNDDLTFTATYDADAVKSIVKSQIGTPTTVCFLHFMPSRAYRTFTPSPYRYYLSSANIVGEGDVAVSFGFQPEK